MSRCLTPLVAIMTLLPGIAAAQTPFSGYGGVKCSKFISTWEKNDIPNLEIAEAWASGFWTGLNAAALNGSGSYRNLEKYDRLDRILRPIYLKCKTHTDRTVSFAAIQVYTKFERIEVDETASDSTGKEGQKP